MQARTMIAVVAAMLLATGALQANITIDTVTVGNPGNAADTRYDAIGYGQVSYEYNIGKYEVTAGQYTAFLNAVAATDTYGLYNTNMWSPMEYGRCKIRRSGDSGNYIYSVASDFVDRPVNYVSFWDAARFTNWLHNGQGSGDTETGAYTLNGYNGSDGRTISRNATAKYWIPSENEWYKAAYYDPNKTSGAGYWNYPTSSDTEPGHDMADASGNNAGIWDGVQYPHPSPYYTTLVGEFQNSDSPYGTFDQGGNVWEWNETIQDSCARGLRGGAYNNNPGYLLASYQYDYDPDLPDDHPTYERSTIGFRVAEAPAPIPEPITVAGLVMGVAGVLGYLSRRIRG